MNSGIGNLPVAFTSFVGRRREITEICLLLDKARLVTLTGAGGVGKTRLAVQAAAESWREFPDGRWLVDLAPVHEPSAVAAAVVGALRRPDLGRRPGLEHLVGHLARQRTLLVLDNCEHLVEACAELVQTLLAGAPDLRVLVASRQTIGITGEHVLTVPPLSQDEAVDLLRHRTSTVQPEFSINSTNRAAIDQLCDHLDRLPLAIELIATQLRTLTVAQATEQLRDRFALLVGGSTAALPRQRTLRAMVDWSYELCTPAERLLWNRLSVFVGPFALDAVEEVCSGEDIAAHEVLDLLDRLVVQSVVMPSDVEGLNHYRLLETIRVYGRARLAESGEEERLLRRHRDFFLALAERLAANWHGPGQEEALARLRAEHPNLLTALEYRGKTHRTSDRASTDPTDPLGSTGEQDALEPADAQAALRLAAALYLHWCADGFLGAGRRQFDRLLAIAPAPTPARARALWAAAWVAILQGDLATADQWLDEADVLGEQLGDPAVRACVQGFRGSVAAFRGKPEEATALYKGAIAATKRSSGGPTELFWLFQLAIAQTQLGDVDAVGTCERAIAVAQTQGERLSRSYAQWTLGFLYWNRGDWEAGLAQLRAALEIQQGFSDYLGAALHLELLAWISTSRRDYQQAGLLLGAARALAQEVAISSAASLLSEPAARCENAVKSALGPAGYDEALAEGSQYNSPARAIAFALGTQVMGVGTRHAPAVVPNPLTAREREVAALVAHGDSNRQIAAKLLLSPRTVDRHIENILAKFGYARRTQIAAWWATNEIPTRRDG